MYSNNWKNTLKVGFLSLGLGLMMLACNSKSTTENAKNQADDKQNVAQPVTNPNGGVADASVSKEDMPKFKFEQYVYDFGQIAEGQIVKHIFKFKNTGKTPLIIQNASATCGCTVPEWTKEPVAPGDEGELRVEFNSSGKSGPQTKAITIYANTDPANTELTIKGIVLSKTNGPVRNPAPNQ